MVHYAWRYFQVQPVIGVSQVFTLRIVGGSEVHFATYTPMWSNVFGYASHESICLQIFTSGSEFQYIYWIESGMDKHGTAHITAGSLVE